jgi:hypothetical protein
MIEPRSDSDREQLVDTLIALTHMSNHHRTIVGGDDGVELLPALRRRGLVRITLAAASRIGKGQYPVGLIAGASTPAAIETALARISPYLGASAAVAVVIASRDAECCLTVRKKLERMGFRIEAGVRCQLGLVLSARRLGFNHMKEAA